MITVGEASLASGTGGMEPLLHIAPEGRHSNKRKMIVRDYVFGKCRSCGACVVCMPYPPVARSVPSRFTDGYHSSTPSGFLFDFKHMWC